MLKRYARINELKIFYRKIYNMRQTNVNTWIIRLRPLYVHYIQY
jgi:hypothetical protein